MSLKPLRFITMPISHFCEKVRWALDRQGVPYQEEAQVPLFHALATLPATGFRKRTVPVLIDENPGARHVLTDSTDCLRYLASRYGASWLYAPPEAAKLEEELDTEMGPHSRRFFYFHMLTRPDAVIALLSRGTTPLRARVLSALFPLLIRVMRKEMRIDEAGASRSLDKLRHQFDRVNERLRDGRRYLCGDTLSAADLTFAALSAPLIVPPGYARIELPDLATMPEPLRTEIQRTRATPAGQLTLRLYTEDRRQGSGPQV